MKNIDELTLLLIKDIVACPDDYIDGERDLFKDTVNQIYGALLLRDAVKGEEERKESA